MAGERNQIAPPPIPKTPSKAINDMLKKNCNRSLDNIFQAGLAYYICAVFQVGYRQYLVLQKFHRSNGFTANQLNICQLSHHTPSSFTGTAVSKSYQEDFTANKSTPNVWE